MLEPVKPGSSKAATLMKQLNKKSPVYTIGGFFNRETRMVFALNSLFVLSEHILLPSVQQMSSTNKGILKFF